MIYHPLEDRMVMFGGFDNASFVNTTYALTLSGSPAWQLLSPAGPPSGRDIIQGIYDPVSDRMVIHAGWNGVYLNDTWTLEWSTPPVAVNASLIDFVAEPGRVTLNWFVHSTSPARVTVERRNEGGAWASLGSPEASGQDRVSYEDRSVTAGSRYGYRLRVVEGNEITETEEVLIDVPGAYRLELAGAVPNPVSGDRLAVSFTLAARSPGRIDLIDIAGRQVASRDLAAFGPGRHRVAFGEERRLEPGVYLIRLASQGRVLTSKAMVVR
jgi:hypothetical protein